MTNPPEEMLKRLIKYETEDEIVEFRQWFLKQFETGFENTKCSLEEFAVYFLNTLRQCTEVHMKITGTETPKCQTPVRALKANNNREESSTPRRLQMDLSQQNTSTPNDNLSLKSCHLKNNSCIEFDLHSTSRLSTSVDRLGFSNNNLTSTPVRRNVSKNSRRLSATPGSANKSATSSLCLGDFLVINTATINRSHKKKTTPTTNQQANQKSQSEKPKKRLQPISISKNVETSSNSSIFAGESSFSNENNILKISNTELVDKDQCAILAARKSLALNAREITKEIKNVSLPLMPVVADVITTSTPAKEIANDDESLDLKNLQSALTLKRLAEIYAIIIDLNLTTNILNELSFLLNLLNAPKTRDNAIKEDCSDLNQLHLQVNDAREEGLVCLEILPNAVYFAMLCLVHEKRSLASLDSKSLGVVLISERFSHLPDDIKSYLLEMYQQKQQLVAEKPFCDTSAYFDSKPCNNVHFQQEQDSRENFTSHQEFTNFRAQRDLFYKCLKIWETNHLNPTWKFSSEITPKIRELFYISENCINMAHLAKLFVSQLLISASNATSPEEIGLDVDLLKFSKLTQRLIAPSQFSVDYQFPRTEAFFRDFILEARSLAFTEQLKMELYIKLTTQNDSSLDYINISKAENEADEQNVALIDCCMPNDHVVMRPDILNSMLILAKFLGFTIALPYNSSNCNTMPAIVEKNQVRLRSLMQTTFDFCVLVKQAIEQSKLLIAIPWLVQLFAMLDNVTLQLENYMKSLKLLFALYSHLGVEKSKPFSTTSLFIIKLCLGWLFESKQFIAEQYYNYRATIAKEKKSTELTSEFDFIKSKLLFNIESESITLNPYLESLLPIACPFLAEFRVSIMPAKYAQTKNASRTGRYRHITTRIAELSSASPVKDENSSSVVEKNPIQVQHSLTQAFLQSQNSSTRQIIKFCSERCYKSTIKDGQLKILLPAKSNADNLVNEITSTQFRLVYNNIKAIYNDAYAQVKVEWNEFISKILHKRINNALESLLPEETSSVLKKTYFMIIEKEATIKISDWFLANIITDNYFCPNLQEMANKICSANQNKVQMRSSQLIISRNVPCVSDLIDELQYWLHCTSLRVDRFTDPQPLLKLLRNLTLTFENELPSVLYHILGASIIQLLQHIISKHCSHLSEELIEAACLVWLHPNMQKALNNFSSSDICIYDALVTVSFIESFGTKTDCFRHLGLLVISMIRKQVITLNYVNSLFVAIFKHEWHPLVLTETSNMLRTIAKETALVPQKTRGDNSDNENENTSDDSDDNEKSNLFMDMLADLSRDVDFF